MYYRQTEWSGRRWILRLRQGSHPLRTSWLSASSKPDISANQCGWRMRRRDRGFIQWSLLECRSKPRRFWQLVVAHGLHQLPSSQAQWKHCIDANNESCPVHKNLQTNILSCFQMLALRRQGIAKCWGLPVEDSQPRRNNTIWNPTAGSKKSLHKDNQCAAGNLRKIRFHNAKIGNLFSRAEGGEG